MVLLYFYLELNYFRFLVYHLKEKYD
jgi:hypothetical protein